MSLVDPISALAANSSSVAAAKPRNQLDQNSFLQLMIAQFRNQDPTKPKDPSEFLSQLAQFSTVSGIQAMQGSLSTLSESLRSSQALDGASMVGRHVLAPTDSVQFSGSGMITGALDVPTGASSVEFSIKDSAGQLVRRVTLPASGNSMEFAWDGLSERGTPVAAGKYSFSAIASVGGKGEAVPVLLATRVDSVSIDPASNQLTLNTASLGSIPLSSVRRVM